MSRWSGIPDFLSGPAPVRPGPEKIGSGSSLLSTCATTGLTTVCSSLKICSPQQQPAGSFYVFFSSSACTCDASFSTFLVGAVMIYATLYDTVYKLAGLYTHEYPAPIFILSSKEQNVLNNILNKLVRKSLLSNQRS